MKKYYIIIEDSADYKVEAENEEKAKHIAWEWFIEREPSFTVREIKEDED